MKKIFGNVEAIVATFAAQKPRKKCLIQRKNQHRIAAQNTGLMRIWIVGFFVFVRDKFILNIQKARPNQSGFFLRRKVITSRKFFHQKFKIAKNSKMLTRKPVSPALPLQQPTRFIFVNCFGGAARHYRCSFGGHGTEQKQDGQPRIRILT